LIEPFQRSQHFVSHILRFGSRSGFASKLTIREQFYVKNRRMIPIRNQPECWQCFPIAQSILSGKTTPEKQHREIFSRELMLRPLEGRELVSAKLIPDLLFASVSASA